MQGRVQTEKYLITKVRMNITDKSQFLSQIRNISEKHAVSVVCLNREMIAGRRHVETAVRHALRSWESGEEIARSLEIEILLYAAGTRQTGRITRFGPLQGESDYYLCIVPPALQALDDLLSLAGELPDEDWEEIMEEKRDRLAEFFGVTREEREVAGEERFVDLVCEKVALLTVHH